MSPILQSPFVQIALPIMATLALAAWSRLARIGLKLDNHEERLVRIEERTSLVGRRNP